MLYVAENFEPRVLETLPAAIIRFPRSFLELDKIPKELFEIVQKIRLNQQISGTYNGIELSKMKFWANLELPDKRSKPLSSRRVTKTYRFSPATLEKLKTLGQNLKLN